MYFWRIEKLKSEMAVHPLTDRQTLPYLAVFVGLTSAASYFPASVSNLWDSLGAAWSVSLAVFGTIYIYHLNGGQNGQHFLQRYFAIGWVVSLRWIVVLVIAGIALFGSLEILGLSAETTTWYDFMFLAVADALVYWRIGHHVRHLAQRTANA